jgi:hypothetical protein
LRFGSFSPTGSSTVTVGGGSGGRTAGLYRSVSGTAWTSIVSAMAAIPAPQKAAFYSWEYDAIQAMLDACPLARGTTKYFSQSGNDTTGDGSLATPYKTKAKASDVIAASSGDIACLFARGEDWSGETRTWVYQQAAGAAIGNGSSTFVISPYPAGCPEVGDTVVLSTVNAATGGTTQTTTISAVARVAGVSVTITLAAPANAGTYIALRWVGFSNVAVIGKTGVTIGAYGKGPIPNLGGFVRSNSSSVSLGTGNFTTPATRGDGLLDTYSIAETRTVVAVREKGSQRVWRRLSTAYETDCLNGAWAQVSNVVYMKEFEGATLGTTGRNYEFAVSNNVPGIYVGSGSDQVRISEIDVSGMGARITLHSGFRSYGIMCEAGAGKRIVVSDCRAHYNDNHAIGATTGESMLVMRCDAGFCGNADTPYVFYSTYGGQEFMLIDCTCPGALAPANVRHGVGSGPVLAHTGQWSTATDHPSWAAGATSFTVPGGATGAASVVLKAGDVLTSTGGANPTENVTVQSIDRSTGIVTLTAPTTYASTGRTACAYVSSDALNGNNVTYAPKLGICAGFRTPPGPYQAMAMGGGGIGIPFTDTADCRQFVHDCYAEMRTRTAEDVNVFPVRINDSGAAGATTFTLVDGLPSGVTSAGIFAGARVRLLGGGSAPEKATLTSISAITAGATVTVTAALTGANRTTMELEVGMASVPLAWVNLVNACVWNVKAINRLNWRAPNVANSQFISNSGSTSDLVKAWNWDVTFDARAISDPQFSRTRYVTSAGLKFPTFQYSRFRILASGRDNVAWDTTATSSTVKFFDSALIGVPGGDGGTVAAWTQNDTAHLGRNLYVGFTANTSYTADTDPLEAGYSYEGVATVDDASTLLKTAQLVNGYSLEYDIDRNSKSTTLTARGVSRARSEPSGTTATAN